MGVFHIECRNSGTWGSPDDAKVEPTPSVPPEDPQEAKPGPGMGRPIPARRPDQHNRPPEGEWVASGSNLSPGPRQDQKIPGFRSPAGGRTGPEGLFRMQEDKINDVGARRQKTWAPRRRTGLGLGRWGCQRTTSTFSPKDDSDNTWARLEENQPRHLLARREGFLPAKNPSTSFSGCPRAPPWSIKGGPWQPRKEDGLGS